MKRITLTALTLATVASSLVFTSCKKDKDDPKPQSRTELLTAKNWRLSGVTIVTGPITVDVYAALNACDKDGFTKFNTNKSLVIDEGPTKCYQLDPQSVTGSWDLTVNDTKLRMQETTNPNIDIYDVVELSASTLKLKQTTISGGVTEEENVTYTAF
jgi:hypothetical protein